jgi:hypothetical protein
MSTKACIARPDGTSWRGYYVHSDGYPDYTGRVIVEMGRALGLDTVFDHAATAPQGWTHFPDEPSIHHDEPFIISPDQDAGIEWLYLLQATGGIAVYRAEGWDDPDLRRFTHLATIDPRHPGAVADMAALTNVRTGVDAVLAGLDAQAGITAFASGIERLRPWPEPVADLGERVEARAPLGKHRPPAVAVPSEGISMAPDALVGVLLSQGTVRPPAAPGHRWTSWGPLCLVCHRDAPDGQATIYPFIFGSRACIGECASHVDSLLRIYDRSRRGRWRPTRQVHTLANGARCNSCMRPAS